KLQLETLAAALNQKAAELEAQFKASLIPAYRTALSFLLQNQLFPEIEPNELRAISERMDNAAQYVEETQQKTMQVTPLVLGAQQLNQAQWTKAEADKLCKVIDTACAITNSLS